MSAAGAIFELILRCAGPACFISMQVSSIRTAFEIYTNKAVGQLSPIPFLSLLTNCSVWVVYGSLKSDFTVLVPNLTGLVAGLFASIIYHYYAVTGIPGRYLVLSTVIIAFSLAMGLAHNDKLLGNIGVCMAVFLMGSPLATLRTVIRDRSTVAMPFYTSMATWMNALSWSLYGIIIAHDVIIYLPNVIGLVLASVQLSLFAFYGFGSGDANVKKVATR
jgi:solute carrier family 50 (sugar transporter)